jgi:hypothetical protein
LGAFYLDDPAVDDGDEVTNSRTFTVAPGQYRVQRGNSTNWFTTAITCTPGPAAVINLEKRRATITVAANENVTCTFTVDRGVTIRARAYNDLVRNGANLGKRNGGDPWLTDWSFSLFNGSTTPLAAGVTADPGNGIPDARFTYLLPGAYTVCSEAPDESWTVTMPNAVDPLYGLPCTPVTLDPGQSALLLFGAYQSTTPATVVAADSAEARITDENQIFTLPYDPAEEERVSDDSSGEPASQIFLPLVTR